MKQIEVEVSIQIIGLGAVTRQKIMNECHISINHKNKFWGYCLGRQ